MSDKAYRYFAFISYSHRDMEFAHELQRYLEQYQLPIELCEKYPMARTGVTPLFRDEDNLRAGQLDHQIKSALQDTRYLIVICSENSARPNQEGKHYINDEVYYFISANPDDSLHRIIPVICYDDPDTNPRDCQPPLLRQLNILGIDVGRKGKERAFNDVVAAMLGLDPRELWMYRQQTAGNAQHSQARATQATAATPEAGAEAESTAGTSKPTARLEYRDKKELLIYLHRNMFNFKGRDTRFEYWLGTAWLLLIYSVCIILLALTSILMPLAFIMFAVLVLVHVSMTTRRLHDIGCSGWIQLIHACLLGTSYVLILPLCCIKGKDTSNMHGLPPISS